VSKETGFKIYTDFTRPRKDIIEQYRKFVAANISDSMGKLQTMDYRIKPVAKCAAPPLRYRPGPATIFYL